MRIVIATHGTRGDVQPMVAVGRALVGAGHGVKLLVPEDYVAWVRGFGLDADRLNLAAREMVTRELVASPVRGAFKQVAQFRKVAGEQARTLVEASKGADLIVGGGACFGGRLASEVSGAPYRMILYCPQLIPSDAWPPPSFGRARMPAWLCRLGWWMNRHGTNNTMGKAIDEARRTYGLPPSSDTWRDAITDAPIVACDPILAPEQVRDRAVGSVAFVEPGALPADLEAFLADGAPPVYLGFGSMPTTGAEKVTRVAIAAAQAAGKRLILSRGWAGLGTALVPPTVRIVDDVPHHLLFPRVHGVAHHGGAGTTHAALRAGVPQLVVPHMLDQFFWADRVAVAQLGPQAIPLGKLTVDGLAAAFRAFDDPALRDRARDAGSRAIPDGTTTLVARLLDSVSAVTRAA